MPETKVINEIYKTTFFASLLVLKVHIKRVKRAQKMTVKDVFIPNIATRYMPITNDAHIRRIGLATVIFTFLSVNF